MADRDELIALAERCEKAPGTDSALDEAIHEAVFRSRVLPEDEIAARLEKGENVISGCLFWQGNLTASLDAAMALIPDDWTAWGVWSRNGKKTFYAVLSRLRDDFDKDELDDEQDVRSKRCPTPALALCAGALRARAASAEEYMLLTYHDENRQGTADRPALADVKITPAMIAAGMAAYRDWNPEEEEAAALVFAIISRALRAGDLGFDQFS